MQLSVRSESKYQGMKAGDKAMVVPPLHNINTTTTTSTTTTTTTTYSSSIKLLLLLLQWPAVLWNMIEGTWKAEHEIQCLLS